MLYLQIGQVAKERLFCGFNYLFFFLKFVLNVFMHIKISVDLSNTDISDVEKMENILIKDTRGLIPTSFFSLKCMVAKKRMLCKIRWSISVQVSKRQP